MSDEELIRKYQDYIDSSEYAKMLGSELIEIGQNRARGRMPFDKKCRNPFGGMHGGCHYSLADTIAGTLAGFAADSPVTTVEGNLNFLEPVRNTKYVYCDALVKKCGRTLVIVDVEIKDDEDKLIACGLFTFYRLKQDQ